MNQLKTVPTKTPAACRCLERLGERPPPTQEALWLVRLTGFASCREWKTSSRGWRERGDRGDRRRRGQSRQAQARKKERNQPRRRGNSDVATHEYLETRRRQVRCVRLFLSLHQPQQARKPGGGHSNSSCKKSRTPQSSFAVAAASS